MPVQLRVPIRMDKLDISHRDGYPGIFSASAPLECSTKRPIPLPRPVVSGDLMAWRNLRLVFQYPSLLHRHTDGAKELLFVALGDTLAVCNATGRAHRCKRTHVDQFGRTAQTSGKQTT